MASERQIAANRRNAQKSTGPRTAVGKERVSGNAYRHGIRSGRLPSESYAQEIDDLANKIVGESRSPIALEWARTAAEATLELARVRRVRTAMIEQVIHLGRLPAELPFGSVNEVRLLSRWLKHREMTPADLNSDRAANLPLHEPDRTAEAVRCLLHEFRILARYEWRAWSRRKKAIRSICARIDIINLIASDAELLAYSELDDALGLTAMASEALAGARTDFNRPGKPTRQWVVESFNATVRSECLGRHWFLDLDDAPEKVEEWRTGVRHG